MAKTIGGDAKLYYKVDGQGGAGSWLELARVKDVNCNPGKGEADTTTRSSEGWETQTSGFKTLDLTFELGWNPGDAGFEAVRDAYLNNDVLGFRVLDSATGEGPMGDFEIFEFAVNQPLKEESSVSVSAKLTDATTAPSWYETP